MSELSITFSKSHKKERLAIVDGLPGGMADFTPEKLRSLANTLYQIANDIDEDNRFHKKYEY